MSLSLMTCLTYITQFLNLVLSNEPENINVFKTQQPLLMKDVQDPSLKMENNCNFSYNMCTSLQKP